MNEVVVELEGDVHVIKNVTGTKQLREFYNTVVKNNWEKYVGITTQGIRYGFSSEKNAAVRLSDTEKFAVNPNFRASKVENRIAEKKEEVKVEAKAEEVKAAEAKPVETVEAKPVEQPAQTTINYEQLFKQEQNKIRQLQQSLNAVNTQLRTQSERAAFAEKQMTPLMEAKTINEGRINELTNELTKKAEQLAVVTAENEALKKNAQVTADYSTLSTDALIKLLVDKGYKVTISK